MPPEHLQVVERHEKLLIFMPEGGEAERGSRAHANRSGVMVITGHPDSEVMIRPAGILTVVTCHRPLVSTVVVFTPPPPKSLPEAEGARSSSCVNTKNCECRVWKREYR